METKQTCPRRMQQSGPWERKEGLDTWEKRGNDTTCSFCGSMHPDEFMALCEESTKPNALVEIEKTDKRYKYYIKRPGILNAQQGAIKFYMQHLSDEQRGQLRAILCSAA